MTSPIAIACAVLAVAAALALVWPELRTLTGLERRRQTGGSEGLVGEIGRVLSADGDGLWVAVHGERWQARLDDASPCSQDQAVEVLGVDGLRLLVRVLERPPAPPAARRGLPASRKLGLALWAAAALIAVFALGQPWWIAFGVPGLAAVVLLVLALLSSSN